MEETSDNISRVLYTKKLSAVDAFRWALLFGALNALGAIAELNCLDLVFGTACLQVQSDQDSTPGYTRGLYRQAEEQAVHPSCELCSL